MSCTSPALFLVMGIGCLLIAFSLTPSHSGLINHFVFSSVPLSFGSSIHHLNKVTTHVFKWDYVVTKATDKPWSSASHEWWGDGGGRCSCRLTNGRHQHISISDKSSSSDVPLSSQAVGRYFRVKHLCCQISAKWSPTQRSEIFSIYTK